MVKSLLLSLCLLLNVFLLNAAEVDTHTFENEVMQKRYNALVKELRCPKCQNQNLADSNSPIASDLRQEVFELLQARKSDIEIVDFMVKRYGDFVLYRPRVSGLTYLLWYGPAILLLIGVIVVIMVLRKKATVQGDQKAALSPEQKDQLKQILNAKK